MNELIKNKEACQKEIERLENKLENDHLKPERAFKKWNLVALSITIIVFSLSLVLVNYYSFLTFIPVAIGIVGSFWFLFVLLMWNDEDWRSSTTYIRLKSLKLVANENLYFKVIKTVDVNGNVLRERLCDNEYTKVEDGLIMDIINADISLIGDNEFVMVDEDDVYGFKLVKVVAVPKYSLTYTVDYVTETWYNNQGGNDTDDN